MYGAWNEESSANYGASLDMNTEDHYWLNNIREMLGKIDLGMFG